MTRMKVSYSYGLVVLSLRYMSTCAMIQAISNRRTYNMHGEACSTREARDILLSVLRFCTIQYEHLHNSHTAVVAKYNAGMCQANTIGNIARTGSNPHTGTLVAVPSVK